MSDCYFDTNGCLVCPPQSAAPAQPARTVSTNPLGWNAAANSVDELDGDVTTSFQIPLVAGVKIGIRAGRDQPSNLLAQTHTIYAYSLGTNSFYEIYEVGLHVAGPFQYDPTKSFEIRRVHNRVSFFFDATPVYASKRFSSGALIVNAVLYSAGDTVL